MKAERVQNRNRYGILQMRKESKEKTHRGKEHDICAETLNDAQYQDTTNLALTRSLAQTNMRMIFSPNQYKLIDFLLPAKEIKLLPNKCSKCDE